MVSLRFLALFWDDFKNWSVDSRFHVETRRKMIVNNSINEEEMGGGGAEEAEEVISEKSENICGLIQKSCRRQLKSLQTRW